MRSLRPQAGDGRPRWGLLCFSVVQLLILLALPAADARLEAATLDSPLHMESPTDEACGVHHEHVFCQLCRALSLPALTGATRRGTDLCAGTVHAFRAVADAEAPASAFPPGSPGARAPPRA